jgi:leucyl aminopeptidase
MSDFRPQLSLSYDAPADEVADWLVVGAFEDGGPSPAWSALDERTSGLLGKLRAAEDFTGKALTTLTQHSPRGIKAKRLLLIGLGKQANASRRSFHDAAAAALRTITSRAFNRVALALPKSAGVTPEDSLLAFGVGAVQGSIGPGIRQSEPSRHPPGEIVLIAPSGAKKTALKEVLQRAQVEAEAQALTRKLVNTPPCDLYPETFAAQVADIARQSDIECDIWDDRRLAAEKMGAILGVAQGSTRPAHFAVLRYTGGGKKTLALVGKGVTFDSGGLSLKTNEQMLDMKCDMAGAATVLAATQAVARLKWPINLLTVMPLVENMPSGYSVKLGDVLKARNGRTIEILNTDAEGRVILADALAWVAEQKVNHIVDLATLTGACMIALGTEIAGLMSNHDAWARDVQDAIARAGERAWRLPMDEDFDEALKSKVADCKNAPPNRYGGAITGGKFLQQFVNDIPWVHLDIAGPAWAEKDSASKDAGGTGTYVRGLIELAHAYSS